VEGADLCEGDEHSWVQWGEQYSGFGQMALTAFQAVKNVQKAVKIGKK
jgi:hypothetical protein